VPWASLRQLDGAANRPFRMPPPTTTEEIFPVQNGGCARIPPFAAHLMIKVLPSERSGGPG
jgi:hypothetical protein